jgi:hypothetical protein
VRKTGDGVEAPQLADAIERARAQMVANEPADLHAPYLVEKWQ